MSPSTPLPMSSQALVLAIAMAVSGTVIFLSLSRQKSFQLSANLQNSAPLRSCLLKDGNKTERKKKKVRFAESVKGHPIGNGEDFRKEKMKKKKNWVDMNSSVCRDEGSKPRSGILENRIGLCSGGIVSDSVQKAECSC